MAVASRANSVTSRRAIAAISGAGSAASLATSMSVGWWRAVRAKCVIAQPMTASSTGVSSRRSTQARRAATSVACRMTGALTVVAVTKKGLPSALRLKLKTVECVHGGRSAQFFNEGDELFLRRDDVEATLP